MLYMYMKHYRLLFLKVDDQREGDERECPLRECEKKPENREKGPDEIIYINSFIYIVSIHDHNNALYIKL